MMLLILKVLRIILILIVSLQHTDTYSENIFFVNNVKTNDGGSHRLI